ncbi:hypothetical protein ACFVAV_33410 [Nocardia sp. NPDC057663]|uniref:hypothetical protein n=1 Tax=Nocardia sp. NPDC057663 TaxID=3346201 RepID=UPI003670AA67
MQVGDLVRLGTGGVCQFRVVEIEGTSARVVATVEAPGAYTFSMRLIDLTPWTE